MPLTSEFMAEMKEYLRLVDTLGIDHPVTLQPLMRAMELAPEELMDEFADMARAMGLLPEADGYLEDGTPMFSLESFAEKMGVPLDEAEAQLQAFLADRAAMGLSNDGIVTDARLVHRKQ